MLGKKKDIFNVNGWENHSFVQGPKSDVKGGLKRYIRGIEAGDETLSGGSNEKEFITQILGILETSKKTIQRDLVNIAGMC